MSIVKTKRSPAVFAAGLLATLVLTLGGQAGTEIAPEPVTAQPTQPTTPPRPDYTNWTASLDEAKVILAEIPGAAGTPVIAAPMKEERVIGGSASTAAALVLWDVPSVIVLSEDWLGKLHGPTDREYFASVLLHEYTHTIVLGDLTTGGSLPDELLLTEDDRQWAGGAMTVPDRDGAAVEAIAACTQAAVYAGRAVPPWIAGEQASYLKSESGCPAAYTAAAFRYMNRVSGVDLRPRAYRELWLVG